MGPFFVKITKIFWVRNASPENFQKIPKHGSIFWAKSLNMGTFFTSKHGLGSRGRGGTTPVQDKVEYPPGGFSADVRGGNKKVWQSVRTIVYMWVIPLWFGILCLELGPGLTGCDWISPCMLGYSWSQVYGQTQFIEPLHQPFYRKVKSYSLNSKMFVCMDLTIVSHGKISCIAAFVVLEKSSRQGVAHCKCCTTGGC